MNFTRSGPRGSKSRARSLSALGNTDPETMKITGRWCCSGSALDVGKVLSGTSQQYVPAEFRVVPEVKQAEWYQLDRDIADAEG